MCCKGSVNAWCVVCGYVWADVALSALYYLQARIVSEALGMAVYVDACVVSCVVLFACVCVTMLLFDVCVLYVLVCRHRGRCSDGPSHGSMMMLCASIQLGLGWTARPRWGGVVCWMRGC